MILALPEALARDNSSDCDERSPCANVLTTAVSAPTGVMQTGKLWLAHVEDSYVRAAKPEKMKPLSLTASLDSSLPLRESDDALCGNLIGVWLAWSASVRPLPFTPIASR